jgi:hemoglobin
MKEILNIADIKLLVDTFYDKVREDELLTDIFNGVIKNRWPQHLEKMYRFWQTILLAEHTYYGSPFAPHAHLPIEAKHFERWIELFYSAIDELFEGEKAVEAKWRAKKMAEMFLLKIEYYKERDSKPLL